jgi:endogenous inhibitor of DNA gyrase (YacG/DUF329 family)
VIDLGNWASERYVVSRPLSEAEEEQAPPEKPETEQD